MTENSSYFLFDGGQILVGIEYIKLIKMVKKLINSLRENQSFFGASIPSLQFSFKDSQCSLDAVATGVQIPILKKLLLGYKNKGPIAVKRGKRVCFTHEGLTDYVSNLPKEYPPPRNF